MVCRGRPVVWNFETVMFYISLTKIINNSYPPQTGIPTYLQIRSEQYTVISNLQIQRYGSVIRPHTWNAPPQLGNFGS